MANLYHRAGQEACLGPEALDELSCLEIDVVDDSPCTVSGMNTCTRSLADLLSSYDIFATNPADGIAYDTGNRVLFVEEDGYKVVLKEALEFVESTVAGLDETKWQTLCSIIVADRYEPLDAFFIYNKYTELNTSQTYDAWAEAATNWDSVPGSWGSPGMVKPHLYSVGDVYFKLSNCDDVICLYVVTGNIDTPEEIYSNSVRLHCAGTGFQKCVGYKRSKRPVDTYQVVQVGSKEHYVEVPVAPPKREILLNDRLSVRNPDTGRGRC